MFPSFALAWIINSDSTPASGKIVLNKQIEIRVADFTLTDSFKCIIFRTFFACKYNWREDSVTLLFCSLYGILSIISSEAN